ncbi:hypothetical protein PhaeoP24_04273 (plasmid) [Phaeobacter inhibens]|uniref:hypothetical protein n=1 Tax=Phaeobacter inhibens TaxID=221822 RepID=UPI000C9CE53F|nr:hypothetical protein [Phaeobacter inhibens]AUQ92831.1 hypothetical protein PhaeoP24_04273 [Phaeobacter inhibens]
MNGLFTILFSAIISFIVAYITAKASGYSKDVVEERQKWREKIRQLTIRAVQLIQTKETQSQEYKILVSEFRVRLNPDDHDDREIIKALEKSIQEPDEVLARKVLAQVSRLLKHDWERAKTEARLLSWPKPNGSEIRRLRSADYLE